jgi:PAS domain S-box-containing protein
MQLQYIPYALPLLVAAAVSTGLALHAWRCRRRPGAAAVTLLMLAVTEWSLAYAFELCSPDLPFKLFWGKFAYLGVVVVPVAWLAFVLQYTGREKWLTRRNVALLVIMPLATLLLVWTNESHRLYYRDVRLTTSGSLLVLDLTYGAWFWVDIAYEYLLVLLGTLLLLQAFVRSPRLYRGQAGVLLIGAFIPWVAEVLLISGLSPLAPLDLTPFAFTLSGLAFAWGLFRYRLLDIVPVARDAIIEGMSDGMIVLDAQNRIVDLNPVAGRIIGRPASEAIGQPINIADWGLRIADLEIEDFHSEIHIPQSAMTFDLRSSPLYDQRGRLTGRVVVLRDVTERKRAEEGQHEALAKALQATHALRESKEHLRAVVTNAPIVLFSTDREGVLTLLEGKGLETLGAEPGADIGQSVFDALRDVPQIGEDIHRALGGEEVTSIVELAGRTFETLYSPLCALDGESTGVIGVATDITGRLLESEERYRDLFEGMPVGLYRTTPEGQIVAANPALVEMLGYPDRRSLLAVNAADVYADSQERAQWQATMNCEGIVRDFEMQVCRRDGAVIWVEDTAHAVRDASGRVLYYEGNLEDIAERKRVEEALRESRVQLECSHQQLADRVAALETLHRIGVAMSSRLETDALLHFIVEQAAKLTDAVTCSILLPDEATGEMVFHAADAPVAGMRVPPGQGIAARALRECESQIVHDVTADPDHYAKIGQESHILTRSLLAVPLLLGDEAIGVLEAVNKQEGCFTEQDCDLLMTMASHAAIAIENARLYEDARQRLAEAELVQEVMLATASTLDLDLAFERTVKALCRALDVSYLGFLLPNEQEGVLVPHPSLVGPAENAFQIPIEDSLVGRAYRTGQPIQIRDLTRDPVYSEQEPEIQSALAVPVRVGDHVVAVLHAESPRAGAFGEDELRLFTTVAGQLGVTLENTRLHEEVQHHAAELEERVRQRTFDLQVLHDLSREVGTVKDFGEFVRLILDNLCHTMPHDVSAGIVVTDGVYEFFIQPTRPLAPVIQGGIQKRLVRTLGRIRGEHINLEQERFLTQVLASETFDAAQPPMASLASSFQVPFIVGQEIVGLLFVGAEQEEAFSEHQMRLLYTIANQASLFLSIRRSEDALRYRVELETLIADISTLFIQLAPGDIDDGMNAALRAIGEFTGIDRTYVVALSEDETRINNTHEWCAEGIVSQIENRRELPVERFPWCAERLDRLRVVHAPRLNAVHLPRVADLPPEAGDEREFLESQGVQSLIAVPMVYTGSLVGFVGFDTVRAEKTWSEDIIALLKIVGEVFVNALERKQAHEQIQASLKEKEVLLQEIHHRVKNNLQVISSLLDLQAGYIEDERTKQMFKESRNRVRSMALIHERLYRAQDLARIDFAEYVRTLTQSLFRSYSAHAASVTLKVNVEDALLDVDAAIPCGLIVNELVSNGLKYAFPAGREGEIRVELSVENDRFTLVVGDNGVGFPQDVDFRNTQSLGLKLVTTLVKQIGGSIKLYRNSGTTFEIKFAAPDGGKKEVAQ